MTTSVDDVEQRLRVALDATIPLLLERQGIADPPGADAGAEPWPLLEPDDLAVDRRSPRRRIMLTAAVVLLLAGTGGLIVTQRGRDTPATSNSSTSSTEPTATAPADATVQTVLDLLPGENWVAIAVQPDARDLSAYDTAGRRVWFSYRLDPFDVAGDLNDDGTMIVRDGTPGDGVAVNCYLDTAERVSCNTTEQGLPAITQEDLAEAGLKLLPLLREGNDGILGDSVNLTASTVDQIQAEQLLAQSLGDEAVSVNIDPGVVTNLPILVPLPLTAPDGSSVVSVVDRFGLLYRVRTGANIDVTDVLHAIPALLGLASSGGAPPMTTLPPEQP